MKETKLHLYFLEARSSKLEAVRGFTVLELLFSLVILTILGVIALSAFSEFRDSYVLEGAARRVSTEIAGAREATLASRNDDRYGVYFATTSITVFKGSTYSAGAATNVITELDPRVYVQSVALAGGGTQVVFSRLTGEANPAGTITLALLSEASTTKAITISQAGLVETN